jgi:hypothetical protein
MLVVTDMSVTLTMEKSSPHFIMILHFVLNRGINLYTGLPKYIAAKRIRIG